MPLISVGAFQDSRGLDSDYGPDWLGAIRGPFGSADQELRTETATSDVVREGFADGLRARALFAEPGQGAYQLDGTITKLDCSRYMRMQAQVHAEVRVSERASNTLLYTATYRVDQVQVGEGPNGIFASVEPLRVLAERAVVELVDQALDDPRLRAATQGSL